MTDSTRVIEHPLSADEPFYGYRYRREVDADGVETIHILPLTYEDLKYPEEGDQVVQNVQHHQLFVLLSNVCPARLVDDPDRYIAADLGFDLGLSDGGKVCPDIAIVRGQKPTGRTATVRVPAMAQEVELVIEITSPSTRNLDFGFRLERFLEAKIKRVIIIDAGNPDTTAIMALRVLDWTPDGYVAALLDPPNRVWVAQLRLWFCIEDNDLVLRDNNQVVVVGDFVAINRRLADEQQRATAAEQAAERERERAELEHQRAEAAEAAYQALLERARARGISLNGG